MACCAARVLCNTRLYLHTYSGSPIACPTVLLSYNNAAEANSYAVGLEESKTSISDPVFTRREVPGHLPDRQSSVGSSF